MDNQQILASTCQNLFKLQTYTIELWIPQQPYLFRRKTKFTCLHIFVQFKIKNESNCYVKRLALNMHIFKIYKSNLF